LIIKVAGGAAVLGPANAEKFKIGERNAEAITDRLKRHGLRPVALDLGGTKGRTLEMHPATGKTFVRTAASPAIEL
jgi:chemotaxis protein CheD